MRAAPQLTLVGKARRAHHVNRAARLFAQQEIEDFLSAGDRFDTWRNRTIPIRQRNGAKTATVGALDWAAQTNIQFELPLEAAEGTPELSRRQRPAGQHEDSYAPRLEPVIRFGPDEASPQMPTPTVPDFSGSRYLYGCLIGAAAAAVILATASLLLSP